METSIKLGIEDEELFKLVKRNLQLFRTQHLELYKQLFLKNKIVSYSGLLLDIISELGLVVNSENEWRSRYIINEFQDLFIITDSFTLPEKDRVFPISDDESLFLANKIKVTSNDTALDIGTGSGIYAISMAKNAKHVVAVDINDKALSYADFNAKLNGLSRKIEFIKSDVYENLGQERFTYIVSNPAVIPAPIGSNFFTHSDGGPLGINMSSKILKSLNEYLAPNGKMQMLCTSLSDIYNEYILYQMIKEDYHNVAYQFVAEELYNPPLEPITKLSEHFKHVATIDTFNLQFKERQLKQLHYIYLEASGSKTFELTQRILKKMFICDNYNGSWEARLARLFLVYNLMSNRQSHSYPSEIYAQFS